MRFARSTAVTDPDSVACDTDVAPTIAAGSGAFGATAPGCNTANNTAPGTRSPETFAFEVSMVTSPLASCTSDPETDVTMPVTVSPERSECGAIDARVRACPKSCVAMMSNVMRVSFRMVVMVVMVVLVSRAAVSDLTSPW